MIALWVTLAFAHGGHPSTKPWEACHAHALGDPCAWQEADLDYRGTCRQVDAALLCVRNQPLASRQAPPTLAIGLGALATLAGGA